MYARKAFVIFVFLWSFSQITCGEDVKQDRRVTASYSGTTVSSNEGIFSSPGYPGIYPQDYIYRYDIYIGQEKADVVIDFKFFELENCVACTCDSLRIENRLTKTLTFCGNTLPNGNGRVYLDNVDDYVWISFSSNGQNEFPGFYATYRVIRRTGSTASYGSSVCPPLSCPVCSFGQTAHYDYGGVCPYCYCRYNYIYETSLGPCLTSLPWWYDTTTRRRYETTTRRPYETTTRRRYETTTRHRYDTTTRRRYVTTTRRHHDTTTKHWHFRTSQWPCWYDTTIRDWNHKTSPHPWWYDTTTKSWNHKTSPHQRWYDTTTRGWNHKTSAKPWWYDTTTKDWNHKTSAKPRWYDTTIKSWNHKTSSHQWWYDTTTRGWNHKTSAKPRWYDTTTKSWNHKTSPHQWWYDTTTRGWNHKTSAKPRWYDTTTKSWNHKTSPHQWWYDTTTRGWNHKTSPHQWWYSTTNWDRRTSGSYRTTVPMRQWSTTAWGSCPPIHCPVCSFGHHHQFEWNGRCSICYCQRNSEQTTTLSVNTDSDSPCHKDYYSQEGVIESQNWPHPYLPYTSCDYRIHLSGDNSSLKTVAIKFESFDIETCTSCSCDNLMISGLEDAEDSVSMCDPGKLTVGKTYFVHTYNDYIDINFRTDGSVQKSGFRMLYDYQKNETNYDACPSSNCLYHCGSTTTYHMDYFGCCVCDDAYVTTTYGWHTTPAYERLPKSSLLQMLRDLASQAGRIGGEDARGVSDEARSIYDTVSRFFIDNFSRRRREAAGS